jgi:Molybdopterin-binding domain of aldehyde dehydrogenase
MPSNSGQIRDGVVQVIGTALYEQIPYDDAGQPLAGTLADYLLPGAAEMPAIKIGHLHNPTPPTEYGIKGMGEGGAVAPPPRSPTPSARRAFRNWRRSQRNPDHLTRGHGGNSTGAQSSDDEVTSTTRTHSALHCGRPIFRDSPCALWLRPASSKS